MPYVNSSIRENIDGPSAWANRTGLDSFISKMNMLKQDGSLVPPSNQKTWQNPGVLNYIITRLCHWWLGDSPNYEKFNEVIGVLECAKQELYRRKVSPYEDEKINENGDV